MGFGASPKCACRPVGTRYNAFVSVIQKTIAFEGSRGRSDAVALFDSRATYSCINPDLARALAAVEPLPKPMVFATAKNG